jgi:deoxyribonuclease-4
MIGAHLSRSTAVADRAIADADVVQVFVSNPRGYQPPDRKTVEALRDLGDVPVFAHLPYLVNPASADPSVRARSRALIEATDRAGVGVLAGVVVHAGQGGPQASVEEAIDRWVDALQGLTLTVPLLVENTAGGNAAPGRRTEHHVELVLRLRELGLPTGVCYDTCHAHAAGLGDLIAGFDDLVAGVGAVDLVHLNDSKDLQGSARDRHANIGEGFIGTDALVALTRHAVESKVPVLLETPGDPAGWATEIALLRSRIGADR